MRYQVRLGTVTPTTDAGGVVTTAIAWSQVYWANMETVKVIEKVDDQRARGVREWACTMRYRAIATAATVLEFQGRTFDITGVTDHDVPLGYQVIKLIERDT